MSNEDNIENKGNWTVQHIQPAEPAETKSDGQRKALPVLQLPTFYNRRENLTSSCNVVAEAIKHDIYRASNDFGAPVLAMRINGEGFPLTREQFGQYLVEHFTLLEGDTDWDNTLSKLWMVLTASSILADRP
jgi:hypothetical protein